MVNLCILLTNWNTLFSISRFLPTYNLRVKTHHLFILISADKIIEVFFQLVISNFVHSIWRQQEIVAPVFAETNFFVPQIVLALIQNPQHRIFLVHVERALAPLRYFSPVAVVEFVENTPVRILHTEGLIDLKSCRLLNFCCKLNFYLHSNRIFIVQTLN